MYCSRLHRVRQKYHVREIAGGQIMTVTDNVFSREFCMAIVFFTEWGKYREERFAVMQFTARKTVFRSEEPFRAQYFCNTRAYRSMLGLLL
jgi:hypothetical protein